MPDPRLPASNAVLLVELQGRVYEVVLPLDARLRLVDLAGGMSADRVLHVVPCVRQEFSRKDYL